MSLWHAGRLAAGMDRYLSKPMRAEPDPDDVIDGQRLQALQAELGELAQQLVEVFERTTPPLLAELRSAEGDAESVRRIAHRIKGSCQNLGLRAMAERAAALEQDPRDARPIDELEALYRPSAAALRAAFAAS